MASLSYKINPHFIRLLSVLKEMDEILSNKETREQYISEDTDFFKADFVDGSRRIKHPQLQVLFREMERLVNDELIDDDGKCPDAYVMSSLREHGYNAVPAETDGFGWLTGVLVTKQFKYLFG